MARSPELPPELWHEVFVRLDHKHLRSCSLVCHEWLPLAQALLLRTLQPINPLEAKLILTDFGERSAWRHIRCIRFSKPGGRINDAAISTVVEILQHATRLQTLEVGLFLYNRDGPASSNVKPCINPTHAQYLFACAPWVTHVQIASTVRDYIVSKSWNMQTIFEILPNDFSFPKLRLLRVYSSSAIPAALFLTGFCKLKLLWISFITSVKFSSRAQALSTSCPELHTIVFDEPQQPADLSSVARFPNLKTIHLPGEASLQRYLDVLPRSVEKVVITEYYKSRCHDPRQPLVLPTSVKMVEVHPSMAEIPGLASPGRTVEVRNFRRFHEHSA